MRALIFGAAAGAGTAFAAAKAGVGSEATMAIGAASALTVVADHFNQKLRGFASGMMVSTLSAHFLIAGLDTSKAWNGYEGEPVAQSANPALPARPEPAPWLGG